MSTTGQALPRLPPPTQRKLTNVMPSITGCWPLQSWGNQGDTFHLEKEDEKEKIEKNMGTTVCRLPYITFTKWSSHHATLPHSNEGQTPNLKENPPITPPPDTLTYRRYRLCSFSPDGWTWVTGWVDATAAESQKASPQKTRECSEVESESICSRTRPSVPQIHPFHLH